MSFFSRAVSASISLDVHARTNFFQDNVPLASVMLHKIGNVAKSIIQKVLPTRESLKNFVPPSEPFFVKAEQETAFRNYQSWCANLRIYTRHIFALLEKDFNFVTFHQVLFNLRKEYETKCQSPIYYQQRLQKLEKQIQALKLPSPYANAVREIAYRFREGLQKDPQASLHYFYHDIINSLIQFSGSSLSSEGFFDALKYYQGLVSEEIYQKLIDDLQQFVSIREVKLNASVDFYAKTADANRYYEEILAKINGLFAPPKQFAENKIHAVDARITSCINQRFIAAAAFVTMGVLGYQFLTPTFSVNDSVRAWSLPNLGPILSQATVSYGLYHQASLPFRPSVFCTGNILAGLFQLSYADSPFARDFNVASLNGTNGSMVYGAQVLGGIDHTIASGDINGDGISDLLIGGIYETLGNASRSFVMFGSKNPFPTRFNLNSLNGTNGFVVNSEKKEFLSNPFSIDSGDINGDNITDFLLGSPSEPLNTNRGLSYVLFGSKNPFKTNIDLNTLNGSNGFVVKGINNNDLAGFSIASGDINGDKIADLLIAAKITSPSQSYVIFGSRQFPAAVDLSSLNGINGFAINNINNSNSVTYAIKAGDINNDGIDDFIIGTRPEVYVLFGSANSFSANFNLMDLNGFNGFKVNVLLTTNTPLSIGTGDINGDGITDLLIGDAGAGSGGGQSFVIYGSKIPFPLNFELNSLNGSNGFIVNGVNSDDDSGRSIDSGDFNGDGIGDLLICAPQEFSESGKGLCYVVFGSKQPFSKNFALSSLDGSNGFTINGNTSLDMIGRSIASGDINGDNVSDILINSGYFGTNYVVFGKKISPSPSPTPFRKKNNNKLSNDIIAGIASAGIFCVVGSIGGVILWKKYKKPLSDRSRTVIEGKYILINKITKKEADRLRKLTGIEVTFGARKNKDKFVLGQGQFGKMRLAYDSKKNFVGVKKIREKNIQSSEEEARLQKQLSKNPNIMPLLDSIQTMGGNLKPVLYHFMPLAGLGNGNKINTYLTQCTNQELKQKILIHIAKGLLTGVSSMHQAHIYHLDIKPDNMVIDIQGNVFVIDFGCAVSCVAEMSGGQGDSRYFSPERLADYLKRSRVPDDNSSAFDPAKVDAWALGLTLLELAIGRYPFDLIDANERVIKWDQKYFEMKLGDIPQLKNMQPNTFFSLVKSLLDVNPEKRLSVVEALKQPLLHRRDLSFATKKAQQSAFMALKKDALPNTVPLLTENTINDNKPPRQHYQVQHASKETDKNYIHIPVHQDQKSLSNKKPAASYSAPLVSTYLTEKTPLLLQENQI